MSPITLPDTADLWQKSKSLSNRIEIQKQNTDAIAEELKTKEHVQFYKYLKTRCELVTDRRRQQILKNQLNDISNTIGPEFAYKLEKDKLLLSNMEKTYAANKTYCLDLAETFLTDSTTRAKTIMQQDRLPRNMVKPSIAEDADWLQKCTENCFGQLTEDDRVFQIDEIDSAMQAKQNHFESKLQEHRVISSKYLSEADLKLYQLKCLLDIDITDKEQKVSSTNHLKSLLNKAKTSQNAIESHRSEIKQLHTSSTKKKASMLKDFNENRIKIHVQEELILKEYQVYVDKLYTK